MTLILPALLCSTLPAQVAYPRGVAFTNKHGRLLLTIPPSCLPKMVPVLVSGSAGGF
jgi:hypothetical protein